MFSQCYHIFFKVFLRLCLTIDNMVQLNLKQVCEWEKKREWELKKPYNLVYFINLYNILGLPSKIGCFYG